MKKNLLIAFALSAAVMTSCSKENFNNASESGNTDAGKYAYTIKGTFASEDEASAEDSKVGIGTKDGNYFGKWEAGDQVVMYEVTSASASRQWITEAPITVSNISTDGKTADISFNLKSPYTEDQKCRAFCYSEKVFPAGLIYGQGCLVAEQVQKGTGLESASFKDYAFIYTTSDAPVKNKVQTPSTSCKFYHALSYVDLSFNSTDFAGWKVEKIIMNKEDGTPMAATKYEVNCSRFPWPYTTETTSGTTKTASVITNVYGTKSSKITLSFSNDVILSDKTQDAWLVSLPTHIFKDTDAAGDPSQDPQKYTVIFQISKDGRTEYAKVRFNTCLKGGTIKPLGVGAITKADIMNDYKEIYDAGLDIKIGDLVVNTTTFPTASVIAPSDLDNNRTKGLIFIDDKEGSTVTLAQQRTFGGNGKIAVIGRYANIGKQTNIGANSLRIVRNTAFLNLKFTCIGGESVFERNSSQTGRDNLYLADCYIDANTTSPKAVIKERGNNNSGNIAEAFAKIYVDNCVVKLGIYNNAPRPFYYLNKPLEGSATTTRTLEIKNSVFFYPAATADASVINVNGNIADDELAINLTSNTIVNMVTGSIVKVYRVKDLVSDKDLVYASGMTTSPGYNTPKYHWGLDTSVYTSNKVGTCTNCYFAWDDFWSGAQSWATYAATNTNNLNKKNAGTPFTATNSDLGYFPVNRTKVTNGAGASYDIKGYCTWE